MPIQTMAKTVVLSQAEFHAIDEKVMDIVFDVHNEFGRFLDEGVYKQIIAQRCQAAGLTAQREVKLRLLHDGFEKDYYIDLLFDSGAILEAKTKETLTAADQSQTLTYLFLTGLHHAGLVNLRPGRVEYEIVSTRLTPESRRRFSFRTEHWRAVNHESECLKAKLGDLLQDWGAFLEASLYRESITHFLGGAEQVIRKVEIFSNGRLVGHQAAHLLTDDTAFSFTSIRDYHDQMREHQLRFLGHTRLKCIQWVNFNQHLIELETLLN